MWLDVTVTCSSSDTAVPFPAMLPDRDDEKNKRDDIFKTTSKNHLQKQVFRLCRGYG